MLHLALSSFSTLLTLLALVAASFALRVRARKAWNLKSQHSAPCTSLTYPILGSLQYFSGHWDFLRRATAEGTVSFHLASQQCIAVPVDKRHEFFSDSRSSFALAYAVMLGATPSMNKDFLRSMGFDITLGGRAVKFLAALLRNERINSSELLSLGNLALEINELNP
jgi:hypothetical protein